ncbi:hypothetical protein SBV1_2270014 [Verrucomicrobia bacterium]|nr:hypothetical protein SBV1_2270014 [Verrucomicrobiota bacterium]
MGSDYDATEFIDGDFIVPKPPAAAAPGQSLRAPTREEVESKVAATQEQLAQLKRAQEELERKRIALEETRRRQHEFETGRHEIVQNLTRGLGLLEKAEFEARRDAELMAKSVAAFRDALGQVEAIHEESWTQDNCEVELTRALTTVENARMEWNAARLKFPLLSGPLLATPEDARDQVGGAAPLLGGHSFGELCRLGFALTWPLAAVLLLAITCLALILARR